MAQMSRTKLIKLPFMFFFAGLAALGQLENSENPCRITNHVYLELPSWECQGTWAIILKPAYSDEYFKNKGGITHH